MTYLFAVYSGVCASLASLFGKLSGIEYTVLDEKLTYAVKIICFCLMILLNGLVWTFFVKALHRSKTSVEATAVCTAVNYTLSGILGFLFFEEISGLTWWLGIGFIILGIAVISSSTTKT